MTPRQLGYRFPAEWEAHEATWLTWPYRDESFPGKLESIYPAYMQFIKQISIGEKVRVNIPDTDQLTTAKKLITGYEIDIDKIESYLHPSNDVWCRDHGPAFLIDPLLKKKAIVNWKFNAWGNKYPSDLDNQIPELVSAHFDYNIFEPGIVMEGGSVDFNGNGTLITTRACLLNKNRNPNLTIGQIENYLRNFYCVEQIIWLGDGIIGDDTDGHVDDITRFINADTVVTAVEKNKTDKNFKPLQENLSELKKTRLTNGKQLNIIELPMPAPVYYEGQRLPASYANFYFTNQAVVMPTFRCKNDDKALRILSEAISDREVVGIDSVELIWGFGSFHCLSQQEPSI
jgi:agmatine deiminase